MVAAQRAKKHSMAAAEHMKIPLAMSAALYALSLCQPSQAQTSNTYFYDSLGRLEATAVANGISAGVRTRYLLDAAGNRSGQISEAIIPRAMQDRLYISESLLVGQRLISDDNRFSLVLQVDGNLVVYGPNGPLWANYSTAGRSTVLNMQTDGNLVIRGPAEEAVWHTNTAGHPGAFLVMQSDGNLVIYEPDWTFVWASGTGGH